MAERRVYIVQIIEEKDKTPSLSRKSSIQSFSSLNSSSSNISKKTKANKNQKFKFPIAAQTVGDLKTQIRERLIKNNAISQQDVIIMTDSDSCQLDPTDNPSQVVPDCKLNIQKIVSNPQLSKKEMKTEISSSQDQQFIELSRSDINQSRKNQSKGFYKKQIHQSQTQVPPIIPISNNFLKQELKLIQKVQQVKLMRMKLRAPQIGKSHKLEALIHPEMTYKQMSQQILKETNYDKSIYKAIVYDHKGQPLFFTLDLFNMNIPKLDLSHQYYVIFTKTKSVADDVHIKPTFIAKNPKKSTIKILFIYTYDFQPQKKTVQRSFKVEIDIANTVWCLKYLIYEKLGIKMNSQILRKVSTNEVISNDFQSLQQCGIKNQQQIYLNFKSDSCKQKYDSKYKFFYKDIEHCTQQSEQSIRFLRSNLLVMKQYLPKRVQNKLIYFIRQNTGNYPLAMALKCMLNQIFLSQCHRIALEQGFYTAIEFYLKNWNGQYQTNKIFLKLRSYLGYCIASVQHVSEDDEDLNRKQSFIVIKPTCALSLNLIKNPVQVQLDDLTIVVVDKNVIEKRIESKFPLPKLHNPTKQKLKHTERVQKGFEQICQKSIGIQNSSYCIWAGFEQDYKLEVSNNIKIRLMSFAMDEYQKQIQKLSSDLKIHNPLQVKLKTQKKYLLLRQRTGKHLVYIGMAQCQMERPHIIYDVFTRSEEKNNLSLMGSCVNSQNLSIAIDPNQIKPVINRQPKQAIAILIDISGSMAQQFFGEKGMNRITAVKTLFKAFADRTLAYKFQHAVSLFLFNSQTSNPCDFTQAIYDFNWFVDKAQPSNATKLYDCIMQAVIKLKKFKQKYSGCTLRILALTDGQDNRSLSNISLVASKIVQNKIIMDSFAVGKTSDGLRKITQASGGQCFLIQSLKDALKLFEEETILSVRKRKNINIQSNSNLMINIENRIKQIEFKDFDKTTNVPEFKIPNMKKQGKTVNDKAIFFENQSSFKSISGSLSLQRLVKEIKNYAKTPHPFLSIYPSDQDLTFWKMLMLGPQKTPYQNALFVLYAQFPENYPQKAPQIRFVTPIYHCNVNKQGRICHSIFDRDYTPETTFKQIINCIFGLLLTPQPDDPLDSVMASQYRGNLNEYLIKAKQQAQKLSYNIAEIAQLMLGQSKKYNEKLEKQKQIENWIERAKKNH